MTLQNTIKEIEKIEIKLSKLKKEWVKKSYPNDLYLEIDKLESIYTCLLRIKILLSN